MSNPWDVIVIGAGIEGSAAAYTLAKRGLRTLQLEQFPLPHSRGSSHGHSRITRMAYAEDFYTRMMVESFRLWAQLEQEAKQQLYLKTGLVVVDAVGSSSLDDVEKAIKSTGETCERLTGKRLDERFPNMTFDSSIGVVFDPTGGILCADKCLRAFQTQFVRHGGVLQDAEPVLSVAPSGALVNVKTSKALYTTRKLVIAAGPWTTKLIQPLGLQLPLEPQRVHVWYWKQLSPDAFGNAGSPVYIAIISRDGEEHEVYGFPVHEYPGYIKVAFHRGGSRIDADRRDAAPLTTEDSFYRDCVAQFVGRHLNNVETTPSITETCIYTVTPDKNFILDTVPHLKNIVVAAGFSGHGFKMAPVVGQIIADLVSDRKSQFDLKPFEISRFSAGKQLQVSRL